MSKVVTIPTYQSPFVVMVNGVKYVFPAGSVQEVPDEVAVVIEANSRKKPEEPVDAPFDCCEGGGSGGGTQSDWNQTDSSAADFIKNKPFWETIKNQRVIYEEQSFSVDVEQGQIALDHTLLSQEEDAYIIKFDGVEYVFAGLEVLDDGVMFGNLSLLGGADTGEPFCCVFIPPLEMAGILVADENDHTIEIIGGVTETKKIEIKYLHKSLALYTDGTYLYKSYDISDTTNRADFTTLESALDAGVPIYLASTTPNIFVPCCVAFFTNGEGMTCGMLKEIDSGREYYTAEYTAS